MFDVRRGVVLLAVLIVVAILILAGYGFIGLMNAEFEAANAANRLAEGRALAESGLHYAAFILSQPQTATISDADDSILINSGAIYDNPEVFFNVPLSVANPQKQGQGYFSIVAPRDQDDPQFSTYGFRFGVEDETGKINLNALLQLDPSGDMVKETLLKIPAFEMTQDQADSIMNWIRPDGAGGDSANADAQYYSQRGYSAKNGPYESLEELLFVRGVTPRQLLGNDQNRNGILEPEEDDNGGIFDPGWTRYMTIYSRERNLDSQGQPRTNINDSNLRQLNQKLTEVLGEEMAQQIIRYRTVQPGFPPRPLQQPRSINSMFELINASFVSMDNQTQQMLKDPNVQREKLPALLDKFTTETDVELPPRINVNTAPREVLAALPGLDEAAVQAIMDHRPSPNMDPSRAVLYRTPAWLLTEANLKPEQLMQIEPFVTTRSQVYRMQIVGYYEQGGPTVRLEAVIDANYGRPRIVYWRDITELGRGYDFRGIAPVIR